ncbi:MAG: hypothetical protein ACJA1A_000562 [Saprospiraceae bacterium]|jgi:hypothetical protein
MKKFYLILVLFLFSTQFVLAQSCLPGGMTFSTQQQIDNFATNYPNCTEIEGNVLIEESINDDITNLNGLAQLTSLGGDLIINYNYALSNLSGLHNITSIGGDITISNITSTNLSGLANLSSIGGELFIASNTALTSISVLSNLSSIGGDLHIRSNPSLTSLSGLENISTVGNSLRIIANAALMNLSGLENLSSIGENIQIWGNDALTSLSALGNISSIGSLLISSNEVLPSLSGLDNIASTNSLSISGNAALTSLSGLDNLSSIGTSIIISQNDVLTSLSALNNLSSIGGFLAIQLNPELTSLSGLDNLSSIGGRIVLWGNDALTSLSGIQNIDPATIEAQSTFDEDLEIFNNASLSECEVQSICSFLDLPNKTKDIHDNMTGCNSVTEINNACDALPPSCTNLTTPTDGSTMVYITTDLTWQSVTDATGYKLTIGTSSGGNDLYDNEDLGNVTTFDPIDFPCATTIYVTITPYKASGDAIGCAEESFTTEEITAAAGDDVAFCAGGSTQLNASGGTVYSWSPTDSLDDANISNPTANPTTTTTYTVTVGAGNGCEDTDEVIVTVNPLPVPNASATDETGNGFNDGTAMCTPTGGTPIYTYAWSNGETTQSIDTLPPTTYTVIVTDANMCSASDTVIVNEFVCPTLTITSTQEDATCFEVCDGSIVITGVTNGVPPFTYLWSNSEMGSTIDSLCDGSYSVTVTDAVNCSISESFTITEPTELVPNATATNETGNGFNDGTAAANPTGGTEPYTYSWSNGDSTQMIIGLSPAEYSVTVTDANGCESTETVNVVEFECQGLIIQSTVLHNPCFGDCIGSISITGIEGGQSPSTYTWDNGSTEESITDLCAGTYSVTVVDGNNCAVLGSYIIEAPNELTVDINSTDESGNDAIDGAATATPSGGTSPYEYEWSNGETTQSIEGLSPNIYTVIITDSNGCTVTDSATIIEFVCPVLEVESTVANASCYGECDGSIDITDVVNAVSPLTYTWTNGASNNNLCTGDYSVTITDSKNCSVEQSYTIDQPEEMIITVDEIVHVEAGQMGSINISSNGDYSYNWTGDNNYNSSDEDIAGLEVGCYTLVVTDPATECTVDTTICVDDLTAIHDWKESSVNVYPNPVDNILTIDFGESFVKEINISITDLRGRQILILSKNSADGKFMVDTKTLNAGIYILKLKIEGEYLYKKIVVTH